MEKFQSAPVIWFIAGFILFLLELAVPGLILFFFAVAAWVVAILTLFIDISLNVQLVIFLVTAVASVAFLRKGLKNRIGSRKTSRELMDEEFVGRTGTAETAIAPGMKGKVAFKGTTWEARSEDAIAPGETVDIIGNDSIVLLVKSSKKI